ncbi:Similar to Ahsa1: Activator of 90 kDa heat shock protein ATPase homolog 1 (Mus musculus) [Cotesia congregata]|uniref:Similar to Ahsa1: Activator of 90 kDa heat shock protein ATPase homolog 1 (Mus musculus) n=1 Tax=Cotesia congregata TaxID=51543 RepID=A0A8J2HKS2_COTCN|nr:Similar to Ahsa1: Activator of 90 kDa heat shock protein ATPase homolog 1 (Mus musculus) [Cotesia congregata]
MAKWGEGDPRWIVEERPDATNKDIIRAASVFLLSVRLLVHQRLLSARMFPVLRGTSSGGCKISKKGWGRCSSCGSKVEYSSII